MSHKAPWLAIALSLLLAAACSGGDDADVGVGPDAGGFADAGPTYEDGDWLFEPERLLRVEIEVPPADWDELRFQTRSILAILGETCGDEPAPPAFTYFKAKVTIEGEVFEEVGIRKKGFLGSLNNTKPSIKVKLQEYVPDQTLSGVKRFTLNNTIQDPSYMNQCLGYKVFRAAGIPAPRCNFATVSVNGTEMGVYTHVESVKKPFLRMHFGNDTGNLYEGTLSDFREGWTGTFDKKTNEEVVGQSDISELSAALALDGDAMRSALEPLVDIDEYMTFWALETLTAHWDGYAGNSNNFFVYDDPDTDKFSFMPWGADQLFGDTPDSITASRSRSLLPNKLLLHDASRADYVAAMTEVLDTAWDDDDALAEITRMETLISAHIPAAEQTAFQDDLALLRTTVTGREAKIRSELALLTANDAESLMEPLCFTETGTVVGDFSTTWEGGGTALLTVVENGTPLVYTQQSSFAGPDDDNPGQGVIAMFGDFADGSRTLLFIPIAQDEVAPSTLIIDDAYLIFYPPNSDVADRFELLGGTLTLTGASTTSGQPVVGSVDFKLWDSPFF
jgi:hypothetical protein